MMNASQNLSLTVSEVRMLLNFRQTGAYFRDNISYHIACEAERAQEKARANAPKLRLVKGGA